MNKYELQVQLELARLKKGSKVLHSPDQPLVEQRSVKEVAADDLAGLLQRAIASEVNRQLAGREAPADHKTIPRRIEMLREEFEKNHRGRPEPAPSYLPDNVAPPINMGTVAPVPVPDGQFHAAVLARDRKGMISHCRFDTPDGKAVLAVVVQRDQNLRIERATFELVA